MSDKLLSVKDELLLDKVEDLIDRKIDEGLSEILKRMDQMEDHMESRIGGKYDRLDSKFMELWRWRCDTDKRLVEIRAILNVTGELVSRTYNRIERPEQGSEQKPGQKRGIRKFFLSGMR